LMMDQGVREERTERRWEGLSDRKFIKNAPPHPLSLTLSLTVDSGQVFTEFRSQPTASERHGGGMYVSV
jgi:hypothetical protein